MGVSRPTDGLWQQAFPHLLVLALRLALARHLLLGPCRRLLHPPRVLCRSACLLCCSPPLPRGQQLTAQRPPPRTLVLQRAHVQAPRTLAVATHACSQHRGSGQHPPAPPAQQRRWGVLRGGGKPVVRGGQRHVRLRALRVGEGGGGGSVPGRVCVCVRTRVPSSPPSLAGARAPLTSVGASSSALPPLLMLVVSITLLLVDGAAQGTGTPASPAAASSAAAASACAAAGAATLARPWRAPRIPRLPLCGVASAARGWGERAAWAGSMAACMGSCGAAGSAPLGPTRLPRWWRVRGMGQRVTSRRLCALAVAARRWRQAAPRASKTRFPPPSHTAQPSLQHPSTPGASTPPAAGRRRSLAAPRLAPPAIRRYATVSYIRPEPLGGSAATAARPRAPAAAAAAMGSSRRAAAAAAIGVCAAGERRGWVGGSRGGASTRGRRCRRRAQARRPRACLTRAPALSTPLTRSPPCTPPPLTVLLLQSVVAGGAAMPDAAALGVDPFLSGMAQNVLRHQGQSYLQRGQAFMQVGAHFCACGGGWRG